MATLGDYIQGRVDTLRLPMSDIDVAALLLKYDLVAADELTKEKIVSLDIAILNVIPDLMVLPDKTTGDTSLKFDRASVLQYYKLKCAEYGIPDLLSQENSITVINDFY